MDTIFNPVKLCFPRLLLFSHVICMENLEERKTESLKPDNLRLGYFFVAK